MILSEAANVNGEIVNVTPELAKQFLLSNKKNRTLSKVRVNNYVRQIINGRWMFNGDAIRFDVNGTLIDGQHRLQAIVESGISCKYVILRNLPESSFETIDQGKARTNGDILSIEGVKSSNIVASISKLILKSKNRDGSYSFNVNRAGGMMGEMASNAEVVEFARNNIGILSDATLFSGKSSIKGFMPPRISGGIYVVLMSLNQKKAGQFLEKLASGEGLVSGSPILAFREKILKTKLTGKSIPESEYFLWCAIAWNAHVKDESVKRIVIRDSNKKTNFNNIDDLNSKLTF